MIIASLPSSSPSAEGIDADAVAGFVDSLEQAPDVWPHSMMILRHGRVAASGWWAPYSSERVQLLYSLSKSFTSTAAGFAVADGLFGLDDRVVDHFPEIDADPACRDILVRHLASMATGHTADMWAAANRRDPADPVRGFLQLPPDRDPGTVFAYNQPATYTLGAIVQRTTGRTLSDYLRERLFDPLGIGRTGWRQQPPGRDLGFTGLHASTDAIARLGLLYLQGGRWGDAQLLPADWVDAATRVQIANPDEPNPDWQQGYGFQFWMSRHGYRGDGAYGQFCLVLPEQDAVVAITSETNAMHTVLDLAWRHLLPAFNGGRGDDPTLADRLARLAVAPRAGRASPSGRAEARTFAPAPGSVLGGARLEHRDEVWTLVLLDGETDEFPVEIRGPVWTSSEAAVAGDLPVPLVASGGWQDDDTLALDVLFIETPHTLQVTCAPDAGIVDARWRTGPLDGTPIRALRCP